MKIFSIETSCDDTAVALIEFDGNEYKVLGEINHSQSDIHSEYGGVFPTIAKREHQKILPCITRELFDGIDIEKEDIKDNKKEEIEEILSKNEDLLKGFRECVEDMGAPEIDAVAVTYGPGLSPALWVGVSFAKVLSVLWDKPIIPVNHMEGHIFASLVKDNILVEPEFPIISLLVSGGHTEMILTKENFTHKKIGGTKDDSVGEAFDKVARMLSLPYPGGPEISKLAEKGRKENIQYDFSFPRPMIKEKNLDFSYSGLKTAVKNYIKENKCEDVEIALEFENAAIEVLIEKLKLAIKEYSPSSILLGGGVSANKYLREEISKLNMKTYIPETKYSTDNAFMIGINGYIRKDKATKDINNIKAEPNLAL